MIYFFSRRGRVSRASVPARRRTGRFAPSMIESLEQRQLLAAGPLGLNVEIGPFQSFVNLMQTSPNWVDLPNQTNPIVLNSSGDPTSDSGVLYDLRFNEPWNGPDPNASAMNLSGTYHLSFNGQATIAPIYNGISTPFTVQNQTYNAATNTTTADLTVPAFTPSESQLFGVAFTNTQATASSPVNTGFSNAKLIRPGYAANTTQVYSDQFIAALKPFTTLRYLDDDGANNQPFFNGNTLVTVGAAQVDQTGMPWELLVALANQSHTDMWINVPQGATDDYVTALAGIIKNGGTLNGVTYAGLDPSLKIYLEYSNEVWGGIPANQYYQSSAVQNSAANQPLSTFSSNLHIYDNADGTTTTDINTAVGRRYLERTADIGKIFQSVLGSDPTHQRIRPVLGWQEDNSNFYPAMLDWYQHFFGTPSTAFYGMGNANYWSATDYSSVDAVINSLAAQETSFAVPETVAFTTLATYYGLANVSYEGGPGVQADPSTAAGQVALAASRDPRMEQLVYQHYLNYFAEGGGLADYYDGPFTIWAPQYEYGLAELSEYSNPTASPKYRGAVDIANASTAALTVGVKVAASGSTSFDPTTDTLGTSFATPTTGQRAYWLLNAASAGTYDLQMTTKANGSIAPGQIEVFLNGKQVGGIISVSPSSVVDLGNLALSSGLSTLSIYVVHGSQDPSQNFSQSYYLFQPSTLTLTTTSAASALGDSGFEAFNVGTNTYTSFAYDPAGTPWGFQGLAGVAGNGSGFTSANPNAPQGTQVGFVQMTGSISQTVTGMAAGTYAITFAAAQRVDPYGGQDFQVLVDGAVVATIKPTGPTYQTYSTPSFTLAAGSHTVKFQGLDTAGGDNAVFLDNVSLAAPVVVTSPTAPSVGDSGFEAVNVGTNTYGAFAYDPNGSPWSYSGNAGVAGNGSGFTSANPNAPQGTQVGFVQTTGSISQLIANWAAGTYAITFAAAQRVGPYGGQDFQVLVDGVVVGTFKPSSTSYQAYSTASFTVSAGPHTIKFQGLDTAGGDNAVFLDNIGVTVAAPLVGDSGFEAVNVGTNTYGAFAYDPNGSPWSYSGNAGVAGNGSGFTSANPNAPQGTQVGFVQTTGSISQLIANWAAGTYAITFAAAQRVGPYGGQDFQVLVDGVVVGTFKPSSTSYQAYSTASFTVSAGPHTIKFQGLDTAGGDNAVFLDNIAIH